MKIFFIAVSYLTVAALSSRLLFVFMTNMRPEMNTEQMVFNGAACIILGLIGTFLLFYFGSFLAADRRET